MEISGKVILHNKPTKNNKNNPSTNNSSHSSDWARQISHSLTSPPQKVSHSSAFPSDSRQECPTNLAGSWIQAFRSQSRGQEVTIPSVKIENHNQLDGMERIEMDDDGPTEFDHLQRHSQYQPQTPQTTHSQLPQSQSRQRPQSSHPHHPHHPHSRQDSIYSHDQHDFDHQTYPVPSDEDTLSATSVKLVQDYIDLSSTITPKTPISSSKHVTLVKRNHPYNQIDLNPFLSNEQTAETKIDPTSIRSQYSGMDKEDTISLIAPKYRIPITEITSSPQQPLPIDPTPSLSITSIPSPRSQSKQRPSPTQQPPQQSHRKYTPQIVATSNSLIGIGGEVLERDDLFVLSDQNSMNRSSVIMNEDSQVMTITGTSISLPFPSSSLAHNAYNKPYHRHTHTPHNNNNNQQTRSHPKCREVNMQHIPLPCTNFDFTDSTQSLQRNSTHRSSSPSHLMFDHSSTSIGGILAAHSISSTRNSSSPPHQQQYSQHHHHHHQQQHSSSCDPPATSSSSSQVNIHSQTSASASSAVPSSSTVMHDESIMTTFVTENTKYILNQYLTGTPPAHNPSVPPGTYSSRPQSQFQHFSPRVVTPKLQIQWQKKFNKQQQKLRQIFQQSMEVKSKQCVPQIPSNKKSNQSMSRINRIQSQLASNLERTEQRQETAGTETEHENENDEQFNHQIGEEGENDGEGIERHENGDEEEENEDKGHEGMNENDDMKSEIQFVLNEMSRTEIGYDIKPLERYSNQIPIEDILMNLETIQHQQTAASSASSTSLTTNQILPTQLNSSTRLNSNSNGNSTLPPTISPVYTPRLLLAPSRKPQLNQQQQSSQQQQQSSSSSSDHHILPPVPHSISLPTVNGLQTASVDTMSLNPLSAASSLIVSSPVDPMEAKKTMTRRILHTHNNPHQKSSFQQQRPNSHR